MITVTAQAAPPNMPQLDSMPQLIMPQLKTYHGLEATQGTANLLDCLKGKQHVEGFNGHTGRTSLIKVLLLNFQQRSRSNILNRRSFNRRTVINACKPSSFEKKKPRHDQVRGMVAPGRSHSELHRHLQRKLRNSTAARAFAVAQFCKTRSSKWSECGLCNISLTTRETRAICKLSLERRIFQTEQSIRDLKHAIASIPVPAHLTDANGSHQSESQKLAAIAVTLKGLKATVLTRKVCPACKQGLDHVQQADLLASIDRPLATLSASILATGI